MGKRALLMLSGAMVCLDPRRSCRRFLSSASIDHTSQFSRAEDSLPAPSGTAISSTAIAKCRASSKRFSPSRTGDRQEPRFFPERIRRTGKFIPQLSNRAGLDKIRGLLARTPRSTLRHVKILVTGAAGLVGRHLAKALSAQHSVAALTHGDLDITDGAAVRNAVEYLRPEAIWNCAVLQVDDCERDPGNADAVNVRGPRHLAEAAYSLGAEIVHFSTQYAFSGEPIGREPYTIRDEPLPVNVYGKTKLAGERAVQEACPASYVIRTSWVYGSGKNSFLCTVAADLKAGRKVQAIDDIWSSTTYIKDLIARCVEIFRARRPGIYHVVNEGVCTYYEFALEAGRLAGLSRERIDARIELCHERDMERIAARPRYTPLRCLLSEELRLTPMRNWRAALAAYLRESRP